jgi:hypothetical protein
LGELEKTARRTFGFVASWRDQEFFPSIGKDESAATEVGDHQDNSRQEYARSDGKEQVVRAHATHCATITRTIAFPIAQP